jgi:glutamyl/glutaminyl-tRNA synthetase
LRDTLAQLPKFDADSLNSTMKAFAAQSGASIGALVHPTRLACTGKTVGPSLYHLMEVLGKERVLKRLDRVSTLSGEL